MHRSACSNHVVSGFGISSQRGGRSTCSRMLPTFRTTSAGNPARVPEIRSTQRQTTLRRWACSWLTGTPAQTSCVCQSPPEPHTSW